MSQAQCEKTEGWAPLLSGRDGYVPELKEVIRCARTHNPWGTDTLMVGSKCQCYPCRLVESAREVACLREALQKVIDETDSACCHCNTHAKACRSVAIQALRP